MSAYVYQQLGFKPRYSDKKRLLTGGFVLNYGEDAYKMRLVPVADIPLKSLASITQYDVSPAGMHALYDEYTGEFLTFSQMIRRIHEIGIDSGKIIAADKMADLIEKL